jgi:hypothetical protein
MIAQNSRLPQEDLAGLSYLRFFFGSFLRLVLASLRSWL